jgi:2-C-methyl-D-erythritol 2,4-cyclodiphosphate synthase
MGFAVGNVDVVVVLERPRVGPHVPAIREALAAVLGVDASCVSVKGKTNEGVDAVGRGEAIGAHAVAILRAR